MKCIIVKNLEFQTVHKNSIFFNIKTPWNNILQRKQC